MPSDFDNARVLVIDDEEMVRETFRSILAPKKRDLSALLDAAADLFGEETMPAPALDRGLPHFKVDEAPGGELGLAMVRAAVEDGHPYAVIFVDMRMPGWDGLQTVKAIRAIDHRVEIVFVTAYNDHSIEHVIAHAGVNVGYHLKPFAPEEIKQIATKATYEWNKLRSLERLIALISSLHVEADQLDAMLNHVLRCVADVVGAESATVLREVQQGRYEVIHSFGSRVDARKIGEHVDALGALPHAKQSGDMVFFPMPPFGIITAVKISSRFNCEKMYLMELFTSHAGQAIENARLHAELLHKAKLSAIGQAMSLIAHDLRNPLGAIHAAMEVISMDDPDTTGRMVRVVRGAAEDALRLVDDVLDYTRNAPVVKAPVSVDTVLTALIERARITVDPMGVRLTCSSSHEGALVANRAKLLRALLNLVINAAEALHGAQSAEPTIVVSVSSEPRMSVIQVRDNGPGMPAATMARLFQPFTTHGKVDGTGLGLAVVRQIVEAHDGTIQVDSNPSGTSFTIHLPATVS
jgi:two-component system, NtrC family, sensor kinase